MNNRKKIAAGACVALITAGVAWSTNGSATATASKHHDWPSSSARLAAASAGSRMVTVIEHEVNSAFVDVGDPGESAGDYFLFEGKLMKPGTQHVVGRDSGKCTLGPTTFICDATAIIFGKGKISVYGAFFSESDGRLPVIGGTGQYKNVTGQLTVTDLSNGDTRLAFELHH